MSLADEFVLAAMRDVGSINGLETGGRNRFYHCERLFEEITKRDRSGDTRSAIYIDSAEAAILHQLLSMEIAAIRRLAPADAEYWDKRRS